jgi:SAM-dependent methyltransferase
MSYTDKLDNYQGDCLVFLGRFTLFSDYIKEFAGRQTGSGVDIGCGPKGCNGNYFKSCKSLDACDAEKAVVDSVPKGVYANSYVYKLGSDEQLPYADGSKEFVVCSCMIQHLNSFKELSVAMNEMSRVLAHNGELFLMFKVGTNDTNLTHFNGYYGQERTFRVFEPKFVIDLAKSYGLNVLSDELLLDENWIPYCCITFKKV